MLAWGLVFSYCAIGFFLPVEAASKTLRLDELRNDLYRQKVLSLPTVSSQQTVPFTIPKTWQVHSEQSYLEIVFQHSSELQPHRSWLEVQLNQQGFTRIPLTQKNSVATRLKIPLSTLTLKDYNTLTFRVEQHYTDRCEDPLDPSLWTQVLASSKLVFHYTPVLPPVDLSIYPFPIIDPLAYDPARIRYTLPKSPNLSELKAAVRLAAFLGQSAQNKTVYNRVHLLSTSSSFQQHVNSAKEHLIIVGTPVRNPLIRQFVPFISGYTLNRGQQWVQIGNREPLRSNTGLLFYIRHPQHPSKTVLIITANTDEGIPHAANVLTTYPKPSNLAGQEYQLSRRDNWLAESTHPKPCRYIETESRTLEQLGFDTKRVEKINAPPITYTLPVVSDFQQHPDAKLTWDLIYSYGPGLNPTFSSLEIRLNDRAIQNIPLIHPDGETHANASVTLPNALIQSQNNLIAQFHLLPEKYGYCINHYVDRAWGTIHPNSRLTVHGHPGSRLPDIGLLNPSGYPYSYMGSQTNSHTGHFADVHFSLPNKPTVSLLEALLSLVTRLGRSLPPDNSFQPTFPSLSFENDSNNPSDKHIVKFLNPLNLLEAPHQNRSSPFQLHWQSVSSLPQRFLERVFEHTADHLTVRIQDQGQSAYLEQQRLNKHSAYTITRVIGTTPEAFQGVRQFFEEDRQFETFPHGYLIQIRPTNAAPAFVNALTASDPSVNQQTLPWIAWLRPVWEHPVLWGLSVLAGFCITFILFLWRFRWFRPMRQRDPWQGASHD